MSKTRPYRPDGNSKQNKIGLSCRTSDDTINWACLTIGESFSELLCIRRRRDTAQNDDAKCQNIWALHRPVETLMGVAWHSMIGQNPCALHILAHSWPSSPEKVFSGSRAFCRSFPIEVMHTYPTQFFPCLIIPRTGLSRESSYHIAAETRAVDCSSDPLYTLCSAILHHCISIPTGIRLAERFTLFWRGSKKIIINNNCIINIRYII